MLQFMELLDNVRQGKFKHTEKAQQTRPYLIAPCTMDPVLLHPGTTKPMSLSEWAELLKVQSGRHAVAAGTDRLVTR